MLWYAWLIYVGIGIASGISSGLLGISGGIIAIPTLLFTFQLLQFDPEHVMHIVIATSLSSMVINGISGAIAHHRKKGVQWKIVFWMVPGLVAGAAIGPSIAAHLPSLTLRIVFGGFLCFAALYFFLPHSKKSQDEDRTLKKKWILIPITLLLSTFATIIGIGGGILTVPLLLALHFVMKKAVATSVVTSLITSFVGAVSYIVWGWHVTTLPYSFGYLYLPAFAVIAVVSFFTAPYGAHLAHRLPTAVLRKIFALLLFAVGILMIVD